LSLLIDGALAAESALADFGRTANTQIRKSRHVYAFPLGKLQIAAILGTVGGCRATNQFGHCQVSIV
jgi:hypothetical protein